MRFVPYKRRIERINDKLYVIYAVYPIERCRDVPTIKQWLGCDTAFKVNSKGEYWFCDEIQDIEWEYV